MTESPRQTPAAWARDVLLTVFLPPLGLLFTGPALFSREKRRRFTRTETFVIGALFGLGVLLTLQIIRILGTPTDSSDTTLTTPAPQI